MTFDKYEKHGDYHWQEWRDPRTPYAQHAAFCQLWVVERPCLDVGCGDGLITHLLGAEGIDSSRNGIELALKHGVNARLFDLYALTESKQYAAVFLGDVIEHLAEPEQALKAILRAIRPSGYLYVVTPPANPTGLHDPYHVREYSPDQLRELVTSFGFTLEHRIFVKPEWVRMYGKFRKV